MSSGAFREWLNEGVAIAIDDEKKLIALAGRIRPIIKERIHEELSKNIKEIANELTLAFYHAFYGKPGKRGEAQTVWEFSLSPKAIAINDERVHLGSAVIAYQLPVSEKQYREPDLTQQEKEKFIRDRSKLFMDFIRNTVLNDATLDEIADDFVQRIHKAVGDTTQLEGDKAKILWRGNITGGQRKRDFGRILLALRLPPDQERELERVVRGVA